jgi:hypothetical protein
MVCDKAIHVGSPCEAGAERCSSDGKEWLTCTAGKLTLAGRCRGPAGCRHVDLGDLGGTIACDLSIAEAGDPCTGAARACTADALNLLSCSGGAFKVETACGPRKVCRHADGVPACAAR